MVSNCQLSTPLPEGKHLIKRQLYRGPFTLREVVFFSFSIDSKDSIPYLYLHTTALNADPDLCFPKVKPHPSTLFLYHKWSKGGHKPGNNATLQGLPLTTDDITHSWSLHGWYHCVGTVNAYTFHPVSFVTTSCVHPGTTDFILLSWMFCLVH